MATKHKKVTSKKETISPIFHSSRVIIENVKPQIDGGQYPIKRVVGEDVKVTANVFADGHDTVVAVILYKVKNEKNWNEVFMTELGNDEWEGTFEIRQEIDYVYTVCAYVDEFKSWQKSLKKKVEANQDVGLDLRIGHQIVSKTIKRISGADKAKLQNFADIMLKDNLGTFPVAVALGKEIYDLMTYNLDKKIRLPYHKELIVSVDPKIANFSSWYEFFPRSFGKKAGKHGSFKECQVMLPEVAKMGFNVVYLPPIHPVGEIKRKGKNNKVTCELGDVGSPWAIGSKHGGHKAINPDLGSVEDFEKFVKEANKYDIEIALDLAYQCAPDHPYVKKHPQWFKWRPDGTVQYAENPPKKYEDVLPINFETEDWKNLWIELKSVVLFWRKKGVKIFRVDNPHTKSFLFWDWMIAEVRKEYPDTIFLAEAFTRPKVMARLAKGGFNQSYTYFTWRYTKKDFVEYMNELTRTELAEYMRPNFWPNTPDILPEHLIKGGRPAFIARAALAATLSSNWGIYGPAYENCVTAYIGTKGEYLDSEKYEIKKWNLNAPGNIRGIITKLNKIRNTNPCLQSTRNIEFCNVSNENIIAYYKATKDLSNILLTIINLDTYNVHDGFVEIPLEKFGIKMNSQRYCAHDLLNGAKYEWLGDRVYVKLDPNHSPVHIMKLEQLGQK